MKISRRNFIKGAAGVMALAAFPNFANGGKKMSADLVIKNVHVFKPDGKVEVANIFITGKRISAIDNSPATAAKIIDGRGKFAVPGFINAHTHASMTLLRSYADDMALMEWLNEHIWPIENKMNSHDIRAGAELAAVEMIKGGTTTFMDMYGPNMEEVAQVVDKSGMRGVLCRGLIGIFNGDEKLATNVELFKDWHGTYTDLGDPCIGDTDGTTFYGQITCVLNIPGTDDYIAMADRWKPTGLGKWMSKKYHKMVEKAMSGKQGERFRNPDRSPREAGKLPHRLLTHVENTSIARYVWLPVEWEGEKPVIRWQNEWKVEDLL